MALIKNAFRVLQSDIALLLKRIAGCRVNGHWLSLVSPGAMLRTQGKTAKMRLGKKCAIRKNVELSATNGTIALGDNAVITAGTLVTRDVPANVLRYDKREQVEIERHI